jgi:outer membrane lipoprotein carrier protein
MIRKLSFLCLFFLMSCLYAAPNDILNQYLKDMHSMQADFSQRIVNKQGKALQQSSGKMLLQRPSQFRWEVKRPYTQLIVTNGVRLWVYDPDLEQVTIRKLKSSVGDTPALLLSDENLSLSKEFNVQVVDSNSTLQWFKLLPRDPNSVMAWIKLGFSDGQIREMHMQDHLGHTTLIQFSHVQINTPIASSLFAFKPPSHVDIIDETKKR